MLRSVLNHRDTAYRLYCWAVCRTTGRLTPACDGGACTRVHWVRQHAPRR